MSKSSNRKQDKTPFLSIDELEKLNKLFEKKKWPIDRNRRLSIFERFCQTLLKLDKNEQEFLIKLTERFTKIDGSEYGPILWNLAHQVRVDYPKGDIIFAPCLPECNIGEMKSAGDALYEMKSTKYVNDDEKVYLELEDLGNKVKFVKKKTIVVLVDDFVGTGETALGAIAYAREILGDKISDDRLKVLCIASMRQGKETIEANGIQVYAEKVYDKGISDYYKGKWLTKAIAQMESIEKHLKGLEDEFKFGYKHSEALISLKRCPNNTFPIYWLGKKTAPYER